MYQTKFEKRADKIANMMAEYAWINGFMAATTIVLLAYTLLVIKIWS